MSSYIKLENKTIVITGGAGFIGSNLAFYFQENHPTCKVIVFDKFRSNEKFSNGNLKSFGSFKNLLGFRGEIISGDITNQDDLKRLENIDIDYMFHEAAISDTTVLEQDIMIKTNLNAFKDLLELCKRKNARMIYASSAATYGNRPSPQVVGDEEPENIYGFSKLAMDNLALNYSKENNMVIVGLRYFNVYGKREFYKNKTASMVLQLGLQILSGNRPRLFFNSHQILRDFVYIEDIIQANILAINAKKSGVYNVGAGKARSFQDIVDILQNEFKTSYEIEYFQNPYTAYQTHTQADITLTCKELGYEPKYSLGKGIKEYISYIKYIYEKEVKNV
ncbi:MAG: ADP-glyceromanno-heptose 6-epimerase [Campylobacteraceae bacterium]|jgi:ADP-L-glycero-D-manno-heptose 6-epimerase|nr:ADP-glyceromanno-heptose 6-epimerase [Campylobacteraceae bacterium]